MSDILICPVCEYRGEPSKNAIWNGIKGPGAYITSIECWCPKCATMFKDDRGWKSVKCCGGKCHEELEKQDLKDIID